MSDTTRSHSEHPAIDVTPLRYHPGDVIASKYRLEELLGEGGMGSVWRARNQSLGVDVALKLTHGELLSADSAARLSQEAHAAAKLEHPSAVRVFDLGETELGDPFIVMELLRGRSLRDLMDARERLPAIEAVPLLLPIASALVAAHGKGIVHRDIKPDNIVLVTDESGAEVPKIVDFGIAKVESKDVSVRADTTGSIIGSPAYMSPEQARGDTDAIDKRTDIWAFAIVLYELMAGRTPFDGANYHALLRSITDDPAQPFTAIGVNEPALWKIVEQALEKDPPKRYQDIKTFGRNLAKWAIAHNVKTDVTGTSLAVMWVDTRATLASIDPSKGTTGSRPAVVDVDPRDLEAPVFPPPRPPEEPRPERSRLSLGLVGTAALAIGGGAVLVAWNAGRSSAPPDGATVAHVAAGPTPTTTTAAAAETSAPIATGAPSAAAPDASAAAFASAAAAPPTAPASMEACVGELFPPGTFSDESKLDFVCTESDPRRGASALRGQIARVGLRSTTTTNGMRDYAVLSWYEMVVFAIARGRCCPHGADTALDLPPSIGTCPSLSESLDAVARAARDRGDLEPHITKFRESVTCVARGLSQNKGIQSPYTYGALEGQSEQALQKFLRRASR